MLRMLAARRCSSLAAPRLRLPATERASRAHTLYSLTAAAARNCNHLHTLSSVHCAAPVKLQCIRHNQHIHIPLRYLHTTTHRHNHSAATTTHTVASQRKHELKYNVKDVEHKWQTVWNAASQQRVDAARVKPQATHTTHSNNAVSSNNATMQPHDDTTKYILTMFPYPSGNLHMWHVRVYTLGDTIARYNRLLGYNVIHPIGYDAFGLPAENASIERGIHPKQWTDSNIETMRQQFRQLGISFDAEREIATCNADYYKHTQALFLQLYHSNLAYRAKATVNWDPVDQTVLANEQVDSEGRSWRSGAKVEQRALEQWFFRISHYSQQLLNSLETLKEWPERVKAMQQQWIGRSEGTVVKFQLEANCDETVDVFTSRADTLYGVSYVAVAPDSQVLQQWISKGYVRDQHALEAVNQYIADCRAVALTQSAAGIKTKTGCPTTLHVIHPLTQQRLPIFVADYVLSNYGTGCVMGVPAHDERDHEFAQTHDLPIAAVVQPSVQTTDSSSESPGLFTSDNGMIFNSSDKYNGLTCTEARAAITADLQQLSAGHLHIQYRLRDWLVSRQRYWGCPIPMIHCKACGVVPVPYDQLPVTLPDLQLLERTGNPLASAAAAEWRKCQCPRCHSPDAHRETDTLDTFVDSSWYFLRYLDPHNTEQPFSPTLAHKHMPVDVYVGGIEHAILHLLYSRFLTHVLHDHQHVPTAEPFKQLVTQGMVCGETFRNKHNNKPVPTHLVQQRTVNNKMQCYTVDTATNTEVPLSVRWEKMSKSKYNGVDPLAVIAGYGADVTRLFILFLGPPDAEVNWNNQGISGPARWLQRVWTLVHRHVDAKASSQTAAAPTDSDAQLRKLTAQTIDYVSKQYQQQLFNVAVAGLMQFTNDLQSYSTDRAALASPAFAEAVDALLIMLSPMAPHITAELYASLHDNADVHTTKWPQADEQYLTAAADELVSLVVMQGSKKLAELMVSPALLADKRAIEQHIVTSGHLDPLTLITRFVHVNKKAGYLVNIVTQQPKKQQQQVQ